ncbi:hypothetical protein DNTS_011883 [Danionella cerebrum]|uniref:Major facilitator superfamily (MFS) profile domain-containing protein n=1 Tax=Danionella cerebrum TaxID=2873325 RepID=A0A553Q7F0_9TELE|nr:hypothetical protein DNTS_011883 [Danionella translucida]
MEELTGQRRVEEQQSLMKAPSRISGTLDAPPTPPCFIYTLVFFSALGGFLFGYDTGVVSGAMLLLKRQMKLSSLWQELLVSVTVGAAAVSALIGGFLNGRFGRRVCILLASFFFCAGGVILSVAQCLASMTVPVYMAEVSPPDLRGRLVTVNTLFITGGQFIASLLDGAFSYLQKDGWRPRWLLQKGSSQKARLVLVQIRGGAGVGVDEEFDSIRSSIEVEQRHNAGGLVLWRMLSSVPTRRALMVGCGLQMFQQLSGINTVMYYSATILQMSGVRDDQMAIWLASATAFTNFLFTLLGVWLVERVGRRKLTLGSLLESPCGAGGGSMERKTARRKTDECTVVSLVVLAAGFLLSAETSPPVTSHPTDPGVHNSTCANYGFCEPCMLDPACGFCFSHNGSTVVQSSCFPAARESTETAASGRCVNGTQNASAVIWAYNFCPSSYSWIVLLGLILYLAFFAPGMGPMPWTVNSEIYPLWARSTGNAWAFFLYAGLALLGLLFVSLCLPETKALTLEEIEALFSSTETHSYTRTPEKLREAGDSCVMTGGGDDSAVRVALSPPSDPLHLLWNLDTGSTCNAHLSGNSDELDTGVEAPFNSPEAGSTLEAGLEPMTF